MLTDRDLGFVSKLDGDYIECRSIRHGWTRNYFGPARGLLDFTLPRGVSILVVVRQLECFRCVVYREDFYNAPNANRAAMGLEFISFKHRYRYPDGYQWKRDEASKEKPTPADYNYEYYRRAQQEGKTNGRSSTKGN